MTAAESPDDIASVLAWAETFQEERRAEASGAAQSSWDEPDPLPGTAERPGFPVHVFGGMAEYVSAVAEETGTPVDLPGLAVLGVCSSLIAGAIVIEANDGWTEPVNIYSVCLAAPGEGKTPVVARCTSVLTAIEADRRQRIMPTIVDAQALKRLAESREREATTRAAKASGESRLETEQALREAAAENAGVVVPAVPVIYTSEATPEGLLKLLAEQGGRVSVVTDEGVEFFDMTSRYATNGKGNFGVYLKGADGQRYESDRAGRERIVIERVTLTVCLFAQPVVLDALAKDKQANGRGLLARFLWCIPGSLVGSRSVRRPPVSDALTGAYEDRMVALAGEAEAVIGNPVALRLDADAESLFFAWCEKHEPRLDPSAGDLASIVEWGSKLPGQVLRLTGNLHSIRTGSIHGTVTGETMTAALTLAGYFTEHARHVYGTMRADPSLTDAATVLGWLAHRSLDVVTARQVYTSKDWEPDRANSALIILAGYGWVRKVEQPSGTGRPSNPWAVHPKLRSKTEQNSPSGGIMRRFAPVNPKIEDDEYTP